MDSSDDDMWESSPAASPAASPEGPAHGAFELRRSAHVLKLTVDIPSLGLRPDGFACGHTTSCDCRAKFDAGMRMRTHVYRSGGQAATSRFVGPPGAFYHLPTSALQSVMPAGAPLAETDVSGCSINARAHLLHLTGADEAADWLGTGYIDLRDRLRGELEERLGDRFSIWLADRDVSAERAGKELTKALAGSVSPMSFVTVTGNITHSAGPCGPLTDLVALPSGLELCVHWHLSVCHLMMHAVYGSRLQSNFTNPLAALLKVYNTVVDSNPALEDDNVEDAAIRLRSYGTSTRGFHPFDMDMDGPGDNWADYLFLCVHSKHFRSRNRDYFQKTMKFVDVNLDVVPDSVIEAASTFHEWYNTVPAVSNYDQLGLLSTIAKRDNVNRNKLAK